MSLSQVGANIMNARIRAAETQGQAQINAAQTRADALANIPGNVLRGFEGTARAFEAKERMAEVRASGDMRRRMQSTPVTDTSFASATTGLPEDVIGTIRAMSPQNMYELTSVMQGLVPYWKARSDLYIVTKASGAAARLDDDKKKFIIDDGTSPSQLAVNTPQEQPNQVKNKDARHALSKVATATPDILGAQDLFDGELPAGFGNRLGLPR